MLVTNVKEVIVVESDSTPDKFYGIVETVQGQIICTCPSYRFSKYPWTCKHVERYKEEHPIPKPPRRRQPRKVYGDHK